MRFLSLFFLQFAFLTSYSQRTCDSTLWAQPGTYTVIVDTNAYEGDIAPVIMLSDMDLCFIESNRSTTQTRQIHIGIYLVTIYPKKELDETVDE